MLCVVFMKELLQLIAPTVPAPVSTRILSLHLQSFFIYDWCVPCLLLTITFDSTSPSSRITPETASMFSSQLFCDGFLCPQSLYSKVYTGMGVEFGM